ncbi:hypothetical protein AB6A40_001212 [Gnathostoma spinigerum]|uniref:Galactokinase n=1 Tax=Gnathostoma spinigerum TaxID=75299 RepID=A0ABD6ECG5_9BILA
MENLEDEFRNKFGCQPNYNVRCPGRVNLIGEHIDYNNYGVLPMAIEAATNILVSRRDSNEIYFFNTNPSFVECVFKFTDGWIGSSKPLWHHYFLCGWKGVLDHLKLKPVGMNVLLSGNIPIGSGLSSSSSLVCAAAVATLALIKGDPFKILTRAEMADLCAQAEHYIGTQGGGMDQAIEFLGERGKALMINFNPLRWVTVKLPQTALFAVLHCGETLNKASTAHYNERVAECRIGAQIIAKSENLPDWKQMRKLGDVADRLGLPPAEMTSLVMKHLPDDVYIRENILRILSVTDDELECLSLSPNTKNMTLFKLRQRAFHVFSEAARVCNFKKACEMNDIKEMGRLMNESHESCSTLYECSCDKLDSTVRKCLAAGAIGARLTGAGWGGCVVALFAEKVPNLDVLFWTQPSDGLTVEMISEISCV